MPKSSSFALAVGSNHDVAGLDVAMDGPGVVGTGEAVRHLEHQPGCLRRRNRPALEPRLQRLAVDERHRDERAPVRQLLDVVNRADVGVIERGRGAGFGNEAPPGVLVPHQLRRQELQRDEPAEPQVLGLVDDAHAARANLGEDAIVGDRLADHPGILHPGRAAHRTLERSLMPNSRIFCP